MFNYHRDNIGAMPANLQVSSRKICWGLLGVKDPVPPYLSLQANSNSAQRGMSNLARLKVAVDEGKLLILAVNPDKTNDERYAAAVAIAR